MESTKDYKIESKRGGTFQLWTLNDGEVSNRETLVLLFGFYGATEKAISKYCDIYLTRGLSVLYIPSQLLHFALPSHSVKARTRIDGLLGSRGCGLPKLFRTYIFNGEF